MRQSLKDGPATLEADGSVYENDYCELMTIRAGLVFKVHAFSTPAPRCGRFRMWSNKSSSPIRPQPRPNSVNSDKTPLRPPRR
jgi:hypothetical protein